MSLCYIYLLVCIVYLRLSKEILAPNTTSSVLLNFILLNIVSYLVYLSLLVIYKHFTLHIYSKGLIQVVIIISNLYYVTIFVSLNIIIY